MTMPIFRRFAVGATVCCLAAAAHAQSMRAGLWEWQSTIKSQSGELEAAMAEMQKQLADMPPDQRRQMEQMFAQSGMQMGGAKGGAQVMRVCVTPEEAARMDVQADPDCKQEIVQRGGNTMKIRFSCGGDMPSQGEGTFSFKGDTSFSGKFWFQTRVDGQTDRVEMTQEGKWLAASCGNLKPRR